MPFHPQMGRLRHLWFTIRQKKHALNKTLKETSANTAAATKASSQPKFEPSIEVKVEPKAAPEPETVLGDPVFHRFGDFPVEIRFKIWKHIAESTTQVIHMAPCTTKGRPRRKFKFYGHYRSRTPFPPFLQVNHELREEGLRHYSSLVEVGDEFKYTIPFNFNRDVLFISIRLSRSRLMLQSLRNMLPPTSWYMLENVCFQVSNWEMYPHHLDLLDGLPNLKQLHFTSWPSKKYRQNIDQVLDSRALKWRAQDCARMLAHDNFGYVDYLGVDDIDEVDQRPFNFFPLKLEFEYNRLFALPFLAIKLSFWHRSGSQSSSGNISNTDTSDDAAGGEVDLISMDDD